MIEIESKLLGRVGTQSRIKVRWRVKNDLFSRIVMGFPKYSDTTVIYIRSGGMWRLLSTHERVTSSLALKLDAIEARLLEPAAINA